MLIPDPARPPAPPSGSPRTSFVLYVEGPRDRSILRAWAHRLMPGHTRALFGSAVILGGRRPARAMEHFHGRGDASRALCVLDRDGGELAVPGGCSGLHFFTWGRRHIESYLLVPAAIRRALRLSPDDHRVERLLERELPGADDTRAWRDLDAKRLLGTKGSLARALGTPLPLARIARATREAELHDDVHELFRRLRAALGAGDAAS